MAARRVGLCLAAAVLLLGKPPDAAAFTTYAERAEAAANFLEAVQNEDGSWGDRAAVRDTSEAVMALAAARPSSPAVEAGAAWLAGLDPPNLDYLARKVESLGALGRASEGDVERLRRALRVDGWGASARLDGDILSTVVVGRALWRVGSLDDASRRAVIARVLSAQNFDGSLPYQLGGPPSTSLTAEAILFLQSLPATVETQAAADRAGAFLVTSQRSSGAIGDHVYETALAAKALLRLSAMQTAEKETLYAFLSAAQWPDGSLDGDPYATALSLRLFAVSAPNLAFRPGSITLTNPTPQIGEVVTLVALLENLGDEPSASVNVRLFSCVDGTRGAVLGESVAPALPSRGAAAVAIDFAVGHAGTQGLCLVADDGNGVAEQDESDNAVAVEVLGNDGVGPVVSEVTTDYSYISPNGDGVQDAATLRFHLSEAAQVSLEVVDSRGLDQVALESTDVGAGAVSLVWSGQGANGVLVEDGAYTLRIVAVDAAGNVGIGAIAATVDTNTAKPKYGNEVDYTAAYDGKCLAVSPDGSMYVSLFLNSAGGEDAVLVDRERATKTILEPDAGYTIYEAMFSPDGNKLIVLTYRVDGEHGQVMYLFDRYGHGRRVLMNDSGDVTCVRWSPDSRKVFFVSDIGGFGQIYKADLKTRTVSVVVEGPILYELFVSSPNNRRIVYEIGSTANAAITEIMDLQTEEKRRIEFDYDRLWWGQTTPVWNADGSRLMLFRSCVGVQEPVVSIVYDWNTGDIHEVRSDIFGGTGQRIYQTVAFLGSNRLLFDRLKFDEVANPDMGSEELYVYDLTNRSIGLVAKRENLAWYTGNRFNNAYYECQGNCCWTQYVIRLELPYLLNDTVSPDGTKSLYLDEKMCHIVDLDSFERLKVDDVDSKELWGRYRQRFLGHEFWLADNSGFIAGSSYLRGGPRLVKFKRLETGPETRGGIALVEPDPEDRCIVKVSGIAADANFESYLLEYKYLDDPTSAWTTIAKGSDEVVNGVLAHWYVCGLPPGRYALRLTVTDRSGNVVVYGGGGDGVEFFQGYGCRPEGVPQMEYLIYLSAPDSAFAAVRGPGGGGKPFVFSPNGDGVLDAASLGYALRGVAKITVSVDDPDGNPVRSLVARANQDVGVYSYDWDGRDDAGTPVGDGEYTLRLRDEYVAGSPEEITFPLAVDTQPPRVALTSPLAGERIRGLQAVRATALDEHLREYVLQYRRSGEVEWTTLLSGRAELTDGIEYSWHTGGLEGEHELRVLARDLGGNVAEDLAPLVVDNDAPRARLVTPPDGSVATQSFVVQAECADLDVAFIRFEQRADGEAVWRSLETVSALPYLVTVDTANFRHGYVYLRAVATDAVGNVDADPEPLRVLIDKRPPTSRLTDPTAGTVVRGTVPVTASSPDPDVATVRLSYRPATQAEWTSLAAVPNYPYRAFLDTTKFADGYLHLRCEAVDQGGLVQASPDVALVLVDNTAPTVSLSSPQRGAVVGGVCQVSGALTDANLAAYRLDYRLPQEASWVRAGEWMVSAPLSGTLAALDTRALVRGEYELRLTAVDRAGNEQSAVVPVTVRNTAPQLTAVRVGRQYLSLREDSPTGGLEVGYVLTEEAAAAGLEVVDAAGRVVRSLEGLPSGAGEHVVIYDGKDSDGTRLEDEAYVVRVTASDPFDNRTSSSAGFVVDSTAPAIAVTSPEAGADVFGPIQVRGTIGDAHLESYSVEYGRGISPATWAPVEGYAGGPVGDLLGSFDASSLEGVYTLRVTARDKADNSATSVLVPVTVHDPSPPLRAVRLSRTFVSTPPLGLSFQLKRAARATLELRDAGGVPVRTVDAGTLAPGDHTVDLDLSNDASVPLDDGTYAVTVTVDDPLTGLTTVHAAGSFVVDRVPPLVAIASPAPDQVLTDATPVTGAVQDAHLAAFTLSVGPGVNPESWTVIAADGAPPPGEVIGMLDVAELEGQYTLRLEAADLADNQSAARVLVNASPGASGLVSGLALAPSVFSPNGDGTRDEATLAFSLTEPRNLAVTVERRLPGDSRVPVRTLYEGAAEAPGAKRLAWDGLMDDGGRAPDGLYQMRLRLEKPSGGEVNEYPCGEVAVDTVPPAITLVQPAASSTVIDVVPVVASIDEPHPGTYRVEAKPASSTSYALVAEGGGLVPGAALAAWDTRGLWGDYDLRLTATDAAGNTAGVETLVHVADGAAPLLSEVIASRAAISPNGDGVADTVDLSFTLHRAGEISAAVKDGTGRVLRTLALRQNLGPGAYVLTFDGRDETGASVADGAYTWEVGARDPLRGGTSRRSSALLVDGAAPQWEVLAPVSAGYVPRTFSVVGRVQEANLSQATLSLLREGVPVALSLAVGPDGAFEEDVDAGAAEGALELTLRATDRAGNVSTESIAVTIDDAPPVVSLSLSQSPVPAAEAPRSAVEGGARRALRTAALSSGARLPIVGGAVGLSYTATDDSLRAVSLSYASASAPDVWTSLIERNADAVDAVAWFDTIPLTDGVYTLRLRASDRAGHESDQTLSLEVDNTAPAVSVAQPTAAAVITGPASILGTVSDVHLLRYDVRLGAGEAPQTWDAIASYGAAPGGGLLHRWVPLRREGAYTLRVEAVDLAGNRADARVGVTVDTIRPSVPKGLWVALDAQGTPRLSWLPNPEGDLAGYEVLRGGVKIATLPAAASSFLDAAAPMGTSSYGLSARDAHGNVSDPCPEVAVAVDREGPSVAIVSPTSTGWFGSWITVRGTAHSRDFLEYTLEVGAGTAPTSWTALHTSPVPVEDGLLGYYDSGEASGIVTLRLRARDTSGNETQVAVSVHVDNLHPASLQGLTAEVSNTRDVALTWNAGADPDLAGYRVLLYGNRVTSELVSGTAYTYPAAPDGAYSFSVVAVDGAGNESIPSFPAAVTLDTRVPAAAIAAPADGEVVRSAEPLLVSAAVSDYDVVLVQLQYKAAAEADWHDLGPPRVTEVLGSPEAPIGLGGAAARLDVGSLPDGPYELRAVATDGSNQSDPSPAVSAFVLAVPPPAPVDLLVAYASGTATLRWEEPSTTDLAGFRVYRNGVHVGSVPPASSSFADIPNGDGLYGYGVSAYDVGGNESGRATVPAIPVDRTPPVIQVTAPLPGSRGRGDVEVRGSVAEGHPGRTTVELGQGANPTVYSEVSAFEGAPPTSLLGVVATTSLADGQYAIRVRSVDAYGNESAPVVCTVWLDNRPPPPPFGLKATAKADGSVRLQWDAGSDHAAFEVYVGRGLSGPFSSAGRTSSREFVVGQGLTVGTPYSFAVAARDSTGNESTLSNVVEVTPLLTAPPAAPVFYYPAANGAWETARPRTDLVAWSTPGATLSLLRSGAVVDTAVGPPAPETAFLYDAAGFDLSAVSPDGRRTARIEGTRLRVVDNATGAVRDVGGYGGTVTLLSWAPDGRRVAYGYEKRLRVVDVEQGLETARCDDGLYKSAIAWSVDGTKIAAPVNSSGQRAIAIYLAAGGAPPQVFPTAAAPATVTWSPDGMRLAFEMTSRAYVLDLGPGTIAAVDAGDGTAPVFSPDGTRVAYASVGGLRVRNLVTGTLTKALPPDCPYPKWAPHGRSLLCAGTYPKTLRTVGYDPASDAFGSVEELAPISGATRDLGWLADGRAWAFGFEGTPSTACSAVSPRDRFVFQGVPLEPGGNAFTAVASNSLGQQSPPSQTLLVQREEGADEPASDLYVMADRFFLSPSAPVAAAEVLVQTTIKNDSPAPRADVAVQLKARDETGNLTEVGSDTVVEALAPGEERDVFFLWTPPAAGVYELIVTVDPYDTFGETDESNNLDTRFVKVNRTALTGEVLLSEASVGAGEDLCLTLLFAQHGPVEEFVEYTLTVEDERGKVYETLAAGSFLLEPGEVREVARTWNVGGTPAGAHWVRLRALGVDGTPLAEDAKSFRVEPERSLDLSVVFDRPSYLAGETAAITATVRNQSRNAPADGVTWRILAVPPGDGTRFEQTRSVAPLPSGTSAADAVSVPLPAGAVGAWRVEVEAYQAGLLQTAVVGGFEVTAPLPGAAWAAEGGLSITPRRVGPGTTVSFACSVTNTGTADWQGQEATVEVLDPAAGSVVGELPLSLTAASGQAGAATPTFSTAGLPLGRYLALLTISLEGRRQVLAQTGFEVGDVTTPVLAVSSPIASGVYGRSLPVSATADDDVSGVGRVEFRLGAEVAWNSLPRVSGTDLAGVYAATVDVSGLADGPRTVHVRAVDRDGNGVEESPGGANVAAIPVEIDRTPPCWQDGVGLRHASPGEGSAWLFWDGATDRNGPVRWNVYVSTVTPMDFATATKLPNVAAETSDFYRWQYRVTGLEDGQRYSFAVRAEDGVDEPNEEANTVEVSAVPHRGARFEAHEWGEGANGLAVADVDGDGRREVLLATDRGLRVWAQDADGAWHDTSGRFGGPFLEEPASAVLAADLDNDGDRDVVVGGTVVRLLANDGAGHLNDATAQSGLGTSGAASGVHVVAVGDGGRLDLLLLGDGAGPGQPVALFRNQGGLHFQEATAGLFRDGAVRSAAVGDVDADGDADLFLAGEGESRLFLADGDGTFADGSSNLPGSVLDGYGANLADLNGDGTADLFLANQGGPASVYLNDGKGVFRELPSALLGLTGSEPNGASLVGDFDHDGDRDVFVSLGDRSLFLENQGDGSLAEVSLPAGVRGVAGASATSFDADDDGDLDVLTTAGLLLENRQNDGNWLKVRLRGTLSNVDGAGGRAFVYRAGTLGEPTGLVGYAESSVGAGSEMHFGVAAGETYDVRAVFPTGLRVEARGVTGGQVVELAEDDTPPVTEDDYLQDGEWVRTAVEVALSATDDLSGVKDTFYRLDGTEGAYTGPLTVSAEGSHLLEYWSVDAAGNEENPKGVSIRIDRTPPVTADDCAPDGEWVAGGATVTLLPSDANPGLETSGVAHTYRAVDGGAVAEDSPVVAFTSEGEHALAFWSVDGAGNEEQARTLRVKVDATPPSTEIAVGAPKHEDGSLFVSSETTFRLMAQDGGSGVRTSECSINGGPWQEYVGPFRLGDLSAVGEGSRALLCRSADRVGNREEGRSLGVVVDDAPPLVDAGPDRDVFVDPDGRVTVTLRGAVSDAFDPSPTATWREGKEALGSGVDLHRSFPLGAHDLILEATDHLGHRSSDGVRVTVRPRQAVLTYRGQTSGEWSDRATFAVAVHDVTGGQTPVALLGSGVVTFRILQGGEPVCAYEASTDGAGVAQATHWFRDPRTPPGLYTVRAELSDPLGVYAPAALDQPFWLKPETASLEYTGDQVTTVHADEVLLQATLYQEEGEHDGELVDFDAEGNPVWVRFQLYRFGQTPGPGVTPYRSPEPARVGRSSLHPSVGVARAPLPLDELGRTEESYTVTAEVVDSDYVTATAAEGTLAVYEPTGSFFSGGGHVEDPLTGEKDNFGFTFRFDRRGTPRGNFVYLTRDRVAETKTRVKSNSLQSGGFPAGDPPGTPTAVAQGKCNLEVRDLTTDALVGGTGNLTFLLTVEDKGPAGVGEDTLRLEVRHPDGVPYEPCTMPEKEVLGGGNIVIHRQ